MDLNLELNESEDNVRRPLELKEIIDDIDIQSMPEILIFKPFVDNNLRISMVETYRTPILFEVCDGIKNFKIFYAQYRTYNDNKINENFMRWLNFIYQK